MIVHLWSCSRVNPDTFRLTKPVERVNILAHPEKRFYNSDTSHSAKRIAPSVKNILSCLLLANEGARTMSDNFDHLGSGETTYEYQVNPELLETFANPYPDRQYKVTFTTQEVTSLCPITGQPDFYRITITYIPDRHCVESKSLKLYLFSFRQSGMFAETMANRILDDLVQVCGPRWMQVESVMNPRGGIGLTVVVVHGIDDLV
jgi:7-cyano-7-deazaguanine reductase